MADLVLSCNLWHFIRRNTSCGHWTVSILSLGSSYIFIKDLHMCCLLQSSFEMSAALIDDNFPYNSLSLTLLISNSEEWSNVYIYIYIYIYI